MNPNEDFEAQLLARVPRPIPKEWRAEILRVAERERGRVANTRPWRERLMLANYTALAAAWTAIFGLYYLSSEFGKPPDRSSHSAAVPFAVDPWLEQRREIAELMKSDRVEERGDTKPAPAEVPFRSGWRLGRVNRSRIS